MRWALFAALAVSCGPVDSAPCLPSGELRFFMSRGLACQPLAGALTIAEDRKTATLTLENGFSSTCAVSGSDDRAQPIGVCQMTLSCRQSCAACESWTLGIMNTEPSALFGGRASSDVPTCNAGRWSATP